MTDHIPIYQPDLSGNEKKYVDECIESTWISSKGRFIHEFEEGFARFSGAQYATSVCNGTVAIHLCLLALGIGGGDEVIVPTFTYVASVNAIAYVGATPVFVDSLARTWQVDPAAIEAAITPRTKAIMVVHLYGQPCDMDPIMAIARAHNLPVIEDCAEAIGTYYKGQHVGNFGDIAGFSFFGNKTMTTGEGGMVITNNPELHQKAAHFKGQGLVAGREYWHDVVGYNYRMTNICAAIGCAQLERIDDFLRGKQRVAATYQRLLRPELVDFHAAAGDDVVHSYWMCSILVKKRDDREGLRDHLRERGIETRPTFFPAHTMPMYQSAGSFPVATDLATRGINLPSWPGLSDQQLEHIANEITAYYEAATT